MNDVAGVTSRISDTTSIAKTENGRMSAASSDNLKLLGKALISAKRLGLRRARSALVAGRVGRRTVKQLDSNNKSFRLSYAFTASGMGVFTGGATFVNRKAVLQ
jgi:hypothetical protein